MTSDFGECKCNVCKKEFWGNDVYCPTCLKLIHQFKTSEFNKGVNEDLARSLRGYVFIFDTIDMLKCFTCSPSQLYFLHEDGKIHKLFTAQWAVNVFKCEIVFCNEEFCSHSKRKLCYGLAPLSIRKRALEEVKAFPELREAFEKTETVEKYLTDWARTDGWGWDNVKSKWQKKLKS